MGTFTVTLQEAIDLTAIAPVTKYQALGLDQYPIFDEAYRQPLNDKIIAHYNEQEIGHETISMFKYAMARKMNEIMPLYNKHYVANQIAVDPLKTVDIHNVTTGTETNTSSTTTDSSGRVVGSNTPQVRLAGNADYATTAQDSTGHTSAGGTGSQDTSGDGHTTGYSGNPAELVFALRQTFVNVDMMVINELEELFMMVWDNGEEFTRPGFNMDYGYFGYFGWF